MSYVHNTTELSKCVNDISRHLTKHNSDLNDLAQLLEALFELFSRGNELLKIMQQYSISLQRDITKVRTVHAEYKKTVESIALHMESIQEHLQSITRLLGDLHTNASSFISSAEKLGHLAKNTEIRAHHAQREGKGLWIIAKECLALAKQTQLPFHDFSDVLKNLEQLAQPVLEELKTGIDLSNWSRQLFEKSHATLETIDNATTTLNMIVRRIEENSALSNTLQSSIDKGITALKKQMAISLTTIDDLSIRCSHIRSQAEILSDIQDLCTLKSNEGTNDIPATVALQHQFDYFLKENIRSSQRFTDAKKIPTFSQDVYQSILSMDQQITTLNTSVANISEYRDSVGTGMNEVLGFAKQIIEFLDQAQSMYQHLHDLGDNLDAEVMKIETLLTSTTKIFNKMKTLTTFARIEEGRSQEYRTIIGPVVQNFVDLEHETEGAFARFAPKLSAIKKDIQFLRTQHAITQPEPLKYPDYSKIKLFLDDIVRVFHDEKEQISRIVQTAGVLSENNSILENDWQHFQSITSTIQNTTMVLAGQSTQRAAGPAIHRARSKVTLCLSNNPITLQPDIKTDLTSHQVIGNMCCGLFQFGKGVDVIPALCEDYMISDNGLEYTLTIRDGLKYQDGKPLRIDALKEAFILALQGPNFGLFDMIAGAREFIATKNRSILGIRILNDRNMQIRLEYPFLPFLANCATNIADPYIAGPSPIAAGPFRLVEYESGSHITMTANEHYHEGRPAVDEVRFVIIEDEAARYPAFQDGTVDILQATGDTLNALLREQPRVLRSIPELSIQYFIINCQKEPFTNVLVRKAVCHAIDTQTMVKRFNPHNAIPARGLFPPIMAVAQTNIAGYTYDIEAARELLARAGYKKGLPDIYDLDVRDNPSVLRRAEFVKASLTKAGIRVNITPMPWNELLAKQYSNDSILSFGGWIGDNGDPDNFVYPLFHSSSQG
ncbi:hypothetical protein JXB22_06580, partial [candidate division WOR-3 bacterium]|nr:hypothetical protein [candidate division WOR-3 bacterium]